MLISIILPIFNASKFLSVCLDSILAQDLDKENFEIICVDDCSTDYSVSLIKNYQKEHTNIKLIQHEQNRKTGSANNTGLNNAKGKYVWIIDPDDWIEPKCIKKLIDKIEFNKLDLMLFNYNNVSETGEFIDSPKVFSNTARMDGDFFVKKYFYLDFEYYLLGFRWCAIYKLSFLREKGITFPEGTVLEDSTFLLKSLIYSKNMASVEDSVYNYRANEQSITNNNKFLRGDVIFEFSFVAGYDVFTFAEEIKSTDTFYYNRLRKIAIWYFESFGYKVLRTNYLNKRKFYSLVNFNCNKINQLMSNTKWYYKILANPIIGLPISIILTPIYRVKNHIKKHKISVKKEWSY